VTILRRIAILGCALTVGATPALTVPPPLANAAGSAVAVAAAGPRISLDRWQSTADWRTGRNEGLRVERGQLRLATPVRTRTYRAKSYDEARWTSAWTQTRFGATSMIPSWNAQAPAGTWLEVRVRARTADRTGSWDVVARWSDSDRGFRRVSAGKQADDLTSVNVDTVVADAGRGYSSWQLRISLLRRTGTDRSPVVDSAATMTSRVPASDTVATSPTGMRQTVDLPVPSYSQMLHSGTYPQWDNGGEAWCSPTSTTMLLGYWDALPSPRALRWLPDGTPQKPVVHAARRVFDYRYDGAGNWAFNTAYAGTRGLDAYVTRLGSLRSAERYIRAGIPLVASVAFGSGELDGAPIDSTNGHLMVIRGFTAAGDVIVNDPAAARPRGVRRTYDRGQFENAWIPATGGVVYVMRPEGTPLP
jgi:hypothetical protein